MTEYNEKEYKKGMLRGEEASGELVGRGGAKGKERID